MRKLLIFIAALATLAVAGCSTYDKIPEMLDKAPLVYHPTIQQGNVIEQEQINQLEPGMTKRQVKFLLGTAVLTDFFHLNRWDYVYTVGEGSTPDEIRRVTVFFEDDRLVRIAGDMRPQPPEQRVEPKKEIVVEVPDWEPGGKSLWQKGLSAIGLDSDSD